MKVTFSGYVIRRLLTSVVLFFLAVTVTFVIFRMLANPVTVMIGPGAPPGTAQLLMKQFGLDKPLWDQYCLLWLNLLHGNLDLSFVFTGTPVVDIIFPTKLLNTLILMGCGLLVSIVAGIIAGLYAARNTGSMADRGLVGFSTLLLSIPSFWLALIILLFFGFYLDWIPMGGTVALNVTYTSWLSYALSYLHHLAGPLATISLFFFTSNFLITRASAVNVFQEDFVRTFEAMGIPERAIVLRHGLRNAILPELSLIAVQMSFLIAGAIFTETVFSWNGMGSLIYLAAQNSDYPVLQGIFVFVSILVIVSNFVADILYAVIDPRVRYD